MLMTLRGYFTDTKLTEPTSAAVNNTLKSKYVNVISVCSELNLTVISCLTFEYTVCVHVLFFFFFSECNRITQPDFFAQTESSSDS